MKVLHSKYQQIWRTQQWPGLEKVSFHSNPKERNDKECSNYCTTVLISLGSKIMLKILQARLQQYMNWEIPHVQAGLEKADEPEIKLPTVGSWKKQGYSRKTSTASLTTLKPLTVWITTNCGKLLKRWVYQTTLPVSWEICMQVKKQQLELDMEKWTGSKLGKEYVKAVYCYNAYLTYTQSACVLSHFSSVWLFATLWTIALQAPLSVGFSRQEYWSGLPCSPPGDLPNPGIEPTARNGSCIGWWILYH